MSTASVPLVRLGKSMVPALGFGLMGMSHSTYGDIPGDEERFEMLDRALELGCTFWDSADLYGDNEELLGKWFQKTGNREKIFLSTKFGFVPGTGKLEVDSSGEYAKKACAESLRKLGVDTIDLYYMHHANPATPIEETMRALKELQAEGKIKYIGLSAVSSASLRRAVKVAPVDAVQVDYSAFMLDIEGPAGTGLLATCRELGVPLVAAMPLGRGLITSRFANGEAMSTGNDARAKMLPRFMDGNREGNMKTIAQFNELATKKGCTAPQLALAFLLKQGNDIIPIPGTKQLKYLEQNWASIEIKLTDEEEAEIRRFVQSAEIAGGTLPEIYKDMNYINTVEET